jgi:hypothetical protein
VLTGFLCVLQEEQLRQGLQQTQKLAPLVEEEARGSWDLTEANRSLPNKSKKEE